MSAPPSHPRSRDGQKRNSAPQPSILANVWKRFSHLLLSSSMFSNSDYSMSDSWDSLTDRQRSTLEFLEASGVGPIRDIEADHPLLGEFDLGDRAVMIIFDKVNVGLTADGAILPVPRLKRI